MPNAVNTSETSCVISNWDNASANDSPPIDSGEPGMTLGVGVGVGRGVGVGVGVAVGMGVGVGVAMGSKVAVGLGVA